MKKPSVSKSKKGAIFNILWLLIENPKNLKYFRQADIKNQLVEEFGINLDRKTIQDYLDILMDLNLPYELSHENNKGYYISNKIISDIEREIMLNSLFNLKAINLDSRINLFNFLTYDCGRTQKKEYYKIHNRHINSNLNDHFSLVENLEIIQKAIDEKRKITFEYLNYNKFGELMPTGRVYTTIPQKIRYVQGMYYLYNADNFWGNMYCGTKIKYMRNIKLGDYHDNPPFNEKYNFSFEVQIIYDWSIEFIVDHFDDYTLIRDKQKMKAIINTPYEFALDWCKKYAPFFIILNDEIKNTTIKDDLIIENINKQDELIFKIKSGIVDYHYQNPVTESSDYFTYMKGMYKLINFYLGNIGCKITSVKQNEKGRIFVCGGKINIYFWECCNENPSFNSQTFLVELENSYKMLKDSDFRKIMVIFFDDFTEEEQEKIKNIYNENPFIDIHDKFSRCNKSFFYKYLVFEVK